MTRCARRLRVQESKGLRTTLALALRLLDHLTLRPTDQREVSHAHP